MLGVRGLQSLFRLFVLSAGGRGASFAFAEGVLERDSSVISSTPADFVSRESSAMQTVVGSAFSSLIRELRVWRVSLFGVSSTSMHAFHVSNRWCNARLPTAHTRLSGGSSPLSKYTTCHGFCEEEVCK